MKVYLQQHSTKQFLSIFGLWTVDETKARVFANSAAALQFRSEERVEADVFLCCRDEISDAWRRVDRDEPAPRYKKAL